MDSSHNISDISAISGISSISQASLTNITRFGGRVDSLHQKSSLEEKCPVNTEFNHHEKTVKLVNSCEDSIAELAIFKLVSSCLYEVSLNTEKKLSDSTANKLKEFLECFEIKKYILLPGTGKLSEKQPVLGNTDLPKLSFAYDEKIDIKSCMETILREKIREFLQSYVKFGGKIKDISKPSEPVNHSKLFTCSELQTLQWKDKIENICQMYENKLMEGIDYLSRWKELKYASVPTLYTQKAEHLLLQAKVIEMQAKLTTLTTIIRMFKETPNTVAAFKKLNELIDEKLFLLREEISKKKGMLEEYKKLEGTEYTEVLEEYKSLCNTIKKKNQLLKML